MGQLLSDCPSVRAVLYGGAGLAIAMLSSPDAIRSALAASASALLEAMPFVAAGVILARALRHGRHAIAYAGCGCASGPSARSLPAAAATWLLFGPQVAAARLIAAMLMTRVLRHAGRHVEETAHLLGELHAVLPAALIAGASAQLLGSYDFARLAPLGSVLAGATLGFTAAPCGIGAVALAGALRVHAPLAAAAFLSVAGIADLRALGAMRSRRHVDHDAFAYVLLAVASGVVAFRRGDALVHPALAVPLAACAAAALLAAAHHRRRQCATARIAPSLMLAGALIGAPPPPYHATETSMTDLFAGERLTFAGVLSCDRAECALVRYAITCCRADAAPVAVRVEGVARTLAGSWLRVGGTIGDSGAGPRLVARRVERIAAPSDPFIYR